MTKFVLPYEPQYTGHRDGEQKKKKNAEKKTENRLPRHDAGDGAPPSLVPESPRGVAEDEEIK
jgi:hypothetical protein